MPANERRDDDFRESRSGGWRLLRYRLRKLEEKAKNLESRADAFTEHLNTTNTRLAVLAARVTIWGSLVASVVAILADYWFYHR